MGHFIFLVMHLLSVLFLGWGLLFLTIPLHLIYAVLRRSSKIANVRHAPPTPATHVKCPDCRELILKDARVCRFCGCKLEPLPN